MPRIALLNFEMGNIRSLQKAFEHLGQSVSVTSDTHEIQNADVLLLPGDGAFKRAMDEIKARRFDELLNEAHAKQKIIFGVCIGFQLFFENSTEFSNATGLGFLKGCVTRLEKGPDAPTIPHIGWTTTDIEKDSRLCRGLAPQTMFYYVHSYAHRARHPYATATANYGQCFTSVIEHENLFAVQFHPEKSHKAGLKLLQNFLDTL